MYRLYINFKGEIYCKRYFNEEELVNAMVYIANTYQIYDFDIYEYLDNQSYHYRRIYGVEDFNEMLETYKVTKDIEDIPALELKRQILKRIYGGKKC